MSRWFRLNMTVTILFLGPARDLAGAGSARLEAPESTTPATLRDLLAQRFPRIAPGLATMRIAVNQSFVREDERINPGDEVAIIPPVSGG